MDGIVVSHERGERVGVITLDRPTKFNALTVESYEDAGAAVRQLNADGASAIVMRCSGANFCTGGDLSVIDGAASADTLVDTMSRFNTAAYRLFSALDESNATVVSAVRGNALAGGLIITLLSDVVIADTTARFGVPESRVGVGDPFVPARLPGRVGDLRAREMILAGRFVDAKTAEAWGLVTEVCDPAELDASVEVVLGRILRLSAYSRRFYRDHLRKHAAPLANAPGASTDPESIEGVAAFMQRREPNWVKRQNEGWYLELLKRTSVNS